MILNNDELKLIYLSVCAFHDEMEKLRQYQTDPDLIKKFDDRLYDLECLALRIKYEMDDE